MVSGKIKSDCTAQVWVVLYLAKLSFEFQVLGVLSVESNYLSENGRHGPQS